MSSDNVNEFEKVDMEVDEGLKYGRSRSIRSSGSQSEPSVYSAILQLKLVKERPSL